MIQYPPASSLPLGFTIRWRWLIDPTSGNELHAVLVHSPCGMTIDVGEVPLSAEVNIWLNLLNQELVDQMNAHVTDECDAEPVSHDD